MSSLPILNSNSRIAMLKKQIADLKKENRDHVRDINKLMQSTSNILQANERLKQQIIYRKNQIESMHQDIENSPNEIKKAENERNRARHRFQKYQRQFTKSTKGVTIKKVKKEIHKLYQAIVKTRKETIEYRNKVDNETELINEIIKFNKLKKELIKMNQKLREEAFKILNSSEFRKFISKPENNEKLEQLRLSLLNTQSLYQENLYDSEHDEESSSVIAYFQRNEEIQKAFPIFNELESIFRGQQLTTTSQISDAQYQQLSELISSDESSISNQEQTSTLTKDISFNISQINDQNQDNNQFSKTYSFNKNNKVNNNVHISEKPHSDNELNSSSFYKKEMNSDTYHFQPYSFSKACDFYSYSDENDEIIHLKKPKTHKTKKRIKKKKHNSGKNVTKSSFNTDKENNLSKSENIKKKINNQNEKQNLSENNLSKSENIKKKIDNDKQNLKQNSNKENNLSKSENIKKKINNQNEKQNLSENNSDKGNNENKKQANKNIRSERPQQSEEIKQNLTESDSYDSTKENNKFTKSKKIKKNIYGVKQNTKQNSDNKENSQSDSSNSNEKNNNKKQIVEESDDNDNQSTISTVTIDSTQDNKLPLLKANSLTKIYPNDNKNNNINIAIDPMHKKVNKNLFHKSNSKIFKSEDSFNSEIIHTPSNIKKSKQSYSYNKGLKLLIKPIDYIQANRLYDSKGKEIENPIEIDANGKCINNEIYDKDGNKLNRYVKNKQIFDIKGNEYRNIIELDSKGNIKNSNLKVYDIEGKEVKNVPSFHRNTFELHDFYDSKGNKIKNPVFITPSGYCINRSIYDNKGNELFTIDIININNLQIFDSNFNKLNDIIQIDNNFNTKNKKVYDANGKEIRNILLNAEFHTSEIKQDSNYETETEAEYESEITEIKTENPNKIKEIESINMKEENSETETDSIEENQIQQKSNISKSKTKKENNSFILETKWANGLLKDAISSQLTRTDLHLSIADTTYYLSQLNQQIENLEEEYNTLKSEEKKYIPNLVKTDLIENYYIEPIIEKDPKDNYQSIEVQTQENGISLEEQQKSINKNNEELSHKFILEQEKQILDSQYPKAQELLKTNQEKGEKLLSIMKEMEKRLGLVVPTEDTTKASRETRVRHKYSEIINEKQEQINELMRNINESNEEIEEIQNQIDDLKCYHEMMNKIIQDAQREGKPNVKQLCSTLDILRIIGKNNKEKIKMFEIEDEIIEQKLYELNDMYSDENLSQLSFEIKNLQQILRKQKSCFNQLLKIKVPITNTNEMKEMNEQIKEYKLKLVALKRKESDLRAKVEKSIKTLKSYNLEIPAPPVRRRNK